MRRFLCLGPDIWVGSQTFSSVNDARLVEAGQIAVLDDDDYRCESLAASPYFQEVTDQVSAEEEQTPAEEQTSEEVPAAEASEEVVEDKPKRRMKSDAESEVGGRS